MPSRDEYKQQFLERTRYHINLVNKYAEKIKLQFPDHDASKFNILLDSYYIYSIPKEERTSIEQEQLDIATKIHIKNSPHHPEYWSDTDLTGFTRSNYTPNGPIDASDMPDLYIKEMVCDWAAVSYEYGTNTPLEWFYKVNNSRWIFTQHQQKLILDTIRKIW